MKTYSIKKAFIDLGNTIAVSWKLNLESASSYFHKTSEYDNWFVKVFFFLAGMSVVIFGTLFFLIMSLLHIIIMLLLVGILSIINLFKK